MIYKRIFRKEFFITLFLKQNKWHKYGVLIHTLLVVFHIVQAKRYDMIIAGFLHDISKPLVAYQDNEDKITGEYSFTNHEEISYRIIKRWFFVNDFTKQIVRYHYLIRGIKNSKSKQQIKKYNRLNKIYQKLDKKFIDELRVFFIFDNLAKK
jgi:hypothetical protein